MEGGRKRERDGDEKKREKKIEGGGRERVRENGH